jgi:hypothetical protein
MVVATLALALDLAYLVIFLFFSAMSFFFFYNFSISPLLLYAIVYSSLTDLDYTIVVAK